MATVSRFGDHSQPRAEVLRDFAVRYTECGFAVVPLYPINPDLTCTCPLDSVTREDGGPCKSPGKHPIGAKWPQRALKTAQAAREFKWTDTHNLGLLTTFVALDVDRHAPDADGFKTLLTWEAVNGKLPDGPRQTTGGGGMHALFLAPPGVTLKGKIELPKSGFGLEVLHRNHQIVVEPSIHPTAGKPYLWQPDHAPWEIETPLLPA